MKYSRAKSKLMALGLKVLTIFGLLMSTSMPSQADTLNYLGKGQPSLMTMVNFIDGAQTSIDMSCYIFRPYSASAKILIRDLHELL